MIVKPFFLRYNCCVRLDLFLKTSRLVKRRAVAQHLCEAGRVLVNGTAAKQAKEVRVGDLITLSVDSGSFDVEVLDVPALPRRKEGEELCRVVAKRRRASEDTAWDENRG